MDVRIPDDERRRRSRRQLKIWVIDLERRDLHGEEIRLIKRPENAVLEGVNNFGECSESHVRTQGKKRCSRKILPTPPWITRRVTWVSILFFFWGILGFFVAKEIELDDHFQNMGAKMVKEWPVKTSDTAGDGTTTATVLAQAIFRGGLRVVAAGANPMDVKRGIDQAVDEVRQGIKKVLQTDQGAEGDLSGRNHLCQQ